MKSNVIVALAVATIFFATSFKQEGGIQFAAESTWSKTLKKAKAENKIIFMDAYTTWCGPCKMLEKRVFTNPKVGDVMNKNFVNVRVDMESGEGPALANIYMVNAYPTMFFIDPATGKEITRIVGYKEANEIIKMAEKVLAKRKS
jgi:thioredoxin 1